MTQVSGNEQRPSVDSLLAQVADILDRMGLAGVADPYTRQGGRVARGAGDVSINFLDEVEQRRAGPAFYPLGARSEQLAARYGY